MHFASGCEELTVAYKDKAISFHKLWIGRKLAFVLMLLHPGPVAPLVPAECIGVPVCSESSDRITLLPTLVIAYSLSVGWDPYCFSFCVTSDEYDLPYCFLLFVSHGLYAYGHGCLQQCGLSDSGWVLLSQKPCAVNVGRQRLRGLAIYPSLLFWLTILCKHLYSKRFLRCPSPGYLATSAPQRCNHAWVGRGSLRKFSEDPEKKSYLDRWHACLWVHTVGSDRPIMSACAAKRERSIADSAACHNRKFLLLSDCYIYLICLYIYLYI